MVCVPTGLSVPGVVEAIIVSLSDALPARVHSSGRRILPQSLCRYPLMLLCPFVCIRSGSNYRCNSAQRHFRSGICKLFDVGASIRKVQSYAVGSLVAIFEYLINESLIGVSQDKPENLAHGTPPCKVLQSWKVRKVTETYWTVLAAL